VANVGMNKCNIGIRIYLWITVGFTNCLLFRINNLEKNAAELGYTRSETDVILSRARHLMKQDVHHYDVLKDNCEHFATFCVYGEAFSTQADLKYFLCSKQFLHDFLLLFIPYMYISYIMKLDSVDYFVRNHIDVNRKVYEDLLAQLEQFSENKTLYNLYIIGFSAIGTILAGWYFGISE
jgi:hypothetical protein